MYLLSGYYVGISGDNKCLGDNNASYPTRQSETDLLRPV